jgi:hypothetical protein
VHPQSLKIQRLYGVLLANTVVQCAAMQAPYRVACTLLLIASHVAARAGPADPQRTTHAKGQMGLHCMTEAEAQKVQVAIAARLQECRLELHPERRESTIVRMMIGQGHIPMRSSIF